MPRRFTNLQTDLLRSFVAVVDFQSFTEAGAELGRTQSAISQQINRLEELVNEKLITIKGKSIDLTEKGQVLIGYARHILQLNDHAASVLFGNEILGTLKIGLPIDYATDYFQNVITKFANQHTDVALDVRCDWSRNIIHDIQHDNIDVAVAISDTMPSPYVYAYWSERPIWICGKNYDVNNDVVQLITHPEGCYYRKYMIDMLNAEERNWRIVFESPNITSLQEAVLSNMGVSTVSEKTFVKGMCKLTTAQGFSELPHIYIGLFYKNVKISTASTALINNICKAITAFNKPIMVQT